MKRFFQALLLFFICPMLCSCWQVAAARAAKKRTAETGYVMGTVEDALELEDPLGRKKRSLSPCAPEGPPCQICE